jgi:anti-anti-sigma factor
MQRCGVEAPSARTRAETPFLPLMYNYFITYLDIQTNVRRMELDITVFEISGRLILGNLLQSVHSEIREVIDGGARKLAIDLTGLTWIDSSGIGTLLNTSEHMKQLGGQMRLAGATGAVARIFDTFHLERIIPLDADLTLACGRLSSSAATS